MSDKSSGSSLAFFLGLIFGACLGGGLGFLFSSDKGEENRKRVRNRAAKVKEKVERVYEGIRENIEPLVDSVIEFKPVVDESGRILKEVGVSAIDKVQEKLPIVSTSVRSTIHTAKKRFFKNTPR